MNTLSLVYVTGVAAILGALLYAISDVLMLNTRFDLAAYPNVQPHAKLLSGMEKLAAIPMPRIMWGGLVGVFATPLTLIGLWQLHYGLEPAGGWLIWPPVVLLAIGYLLAPFVHGSFIFLAEYIHALNVLPAASQSVVLGMFNRHKQILAVSYGTVMVSVLVASIWFSVSVALGGTRFPVWLAAFNPIVLILIYFVLRRLLPKVFEPVEGAGFNLGFIGFYILTTVALW